MVDGGGMLLLWGEREGRNVSFCGECNSELEDFDTLLFFPFLLIS
jgi:hypothetical protein